MSTVCGRFAAAISMPLSFRAPLPDAGSEVILTLSSVSPGSSSEKPKSAASNV